jgi:hypothetical protein
MISDTAKLWDLSSGLEYLRLNSVNSKEGVRAEVLAGTFPWSTRLRLFTLGSQARRPRARRTDVGSPQPHPFNSAAIDCNARAIGAAPLRETPARSEKTSCKLHLNACRNASQEVK